MKSGFAKKNIIYENDLIHLAGFAKERVLTEKIDEIYVKCFVCVYNNEKYIFYSLDLCAIDELIINRLKKFLINKGFREENIFVSATHTHSSYSGTVNTFQGYLTVAKDIFGETDFSLIGYIVDQMVLCADEAINNLEDSSITLSQGECKLFGTNRNNRQLKGNDSLLTVEIKQSKKKIVIVLFSCHPTILNYENTGLSADFPGYLEQLFEKIGYDFCMYLNGDCGDISTRFTKQSNGVDELKRLTTLLFNSCVEVLADADDVSIHSIENQILECDLKTKTKPTIEEANKFYNYVKNEYDEALKDGLKGAKLRLLENRVEGAQANLKYALSDFSEKSIKFKVKILKINDQFFIYIPGECFSELGNLIENKNIHIICYSNGYNMYFADEKAFDNMVYEAMSSPFEKGESEKMIESIRKALLEMGGK